jgi:hypothetical protein
MERNSNEIVEEVSIHECYGVEGYNVNICDHYEIAPSCRPNRGMMPR